MRYEAGSTPLHAAVKCAGSIGIPSPGKLDTGTLQNDAKVLESVQKRSSTEYLNTLRVLVENGGDPMIVNDHGDTVLHLHTGTAEQFRYLLQQEASIIEISQLNHYGDTIAERHARWYWAEGPKRTILAWEYEDAQRSNRPEAFLVTSKTLLLHETNGHLRHFIKRGGRDFESALSLLRRLVKEGVDIHGVLDEDPEDSKTPLAQIPRIVSEVKTSVEGVDTETKITSFAIRSWLSILEEANVDLTVYVEEEERLIRSLGIEREWELCEYDGEKEYRVDWRFETGHKGSPCSISAEYIFRPVSEEPEELQDRGPKIPDLPGAWPEEID
ncbi:MAG: hypothetical protein Q9216_003343 [Gyalolechia sp. 2 TL-2023]